MLPCAAEAIALARREEDLRPAGGRGRGRDATTWSGLPQQWNEVLEDTVDDLRWALARLPAARLAGPVPADARPGRAAVLRPRRARRARGARRRGARDGAAARRPGAALVGLAHRVEGAVDADARRAPARAWPGRGSRRPAAVGRPRLRGGGPRACSPAAPWRWATGRPTSRPRQEAERLARRRRNSYALMALPGSQLSLAVDARRRPSGAAPGGRALRAPAAAEPGDGGTARRRHPGHRRACGPTGSATWSSRSRPPTTPRATTSAATSLLHGAGPDRRRRPAARGAGRARSSTGGELGQRVDVVLLAEAAAVAGDEAARGRRWPTGSRRSPAGSSVSGISSVDGPGRRLPRAGPGHLRPERAEATAAAERGLEQADGLGLHGVRRVAARLARRSSASDAGLAATGGPLEQGRPSPRSSLIGPWSSRSSSRCR